MNILTTIGKNCTKGALFAIRFYRNHVSRLMLPRCRFHPTCSAYAEEAVMKKGLWTGGWMTLRRLLRCHPFNRSRFYDPVDTDQEKY